MKPTTIKGAQLVIGAEDGYEPLPVLRALAGPYSCIQSAWLPTPEELALLNQGAPVVLTVLGDLPIRPVLLEVIAKELAIEPVN